MKSFLFTFLVVASSNTQIAWANQVCQTHQIESGNFDFDDNLFVTPARIAIWDNVNKAELEVSTAYWALIKGQIAKEGVYLDFSLRPDFLRNFGDLGPSGTRLFKNQIAQALKRQDTSWKGPMWDAFVDALSCPETRKYVSIITAREHAPESILAGLTLLREQGLIPALPDTDRIYPVRWPNFPKQFKGNTDAESKANVMMYLLDRVESQPIPKDAVAVENRGGSGLEKLHVWTFSDDDYGNFSQALETLSAQVKANRWPHIKIKLFFTGLNNPKYKPYSIVITPDGSPRPSLLSERQNELSKASLQ